MGLKFRRRQKPFPGVYLNFSSGGISTTIGLKGFSANLGKKGAYLNTGIPGTGFYDRKKIAGWNNNPRPAKNSLPPNIPTPRQDSYYFLPRKLEGEIKSNAATSVTSRNLAEMNETLLEAYREKIEIQHEIPKIEKEVTNASTIKFVSQILLIGLFTNNFKDRLEEKKCYLENLKRQLSDCKVNIDIDIDDNLKTAYKNLKTSFSNLSTCSKIWDETSSVTNIDNRSIANNSVTRSQTFLELKTIDFINASCDALYLKNQNGSDIYLYPAFAVVFDSKSSFGLVSLSDLRLTFFRISFLEQEQVPSDSKVIGETWAKVTKMEHPIDGLKTTTKFQLLNIEGLNLKATQELMKHLCSAIRRRPKTLWRFLKTML